jgi:alkylation response protein AidB-like acyl-CoA dehydrogenase
VTPLSTDSATQIPGGCSFVSANSPTTFTPEDFSGDEQLMVQTAEQFCRNEVLTQQDRLDAQEDGLMVNLIRHAGQLGFCGPDTKEVYGGLGLPKNVAARMLEFLSLNASFSVTVGITSGISQVGVSLFGSEHLRQKYLPSLTSGEQIGAYCLSEPNSGTDALALATRADLKGDKWVLNGTKMWISNAKWADQFVVMAKVGGEKVTAFVVERDFPGVSISREEHKLGLKGSSTARVILENAEVPAENLLFEEGRGHVVAFNALNLGRFKLASMSIGPAREAMNQASAYAMDRKQFGQSIGNFGLIQQKFAQMAARFFAAESAIYRTGALIDGAFAHYHDGARPEIAANQAGCEEYSVECSICKVLATEMEDLIIDECLQTYGGYGFTEEFPLARLYRDARVSRIYEGTNEINRFFIGTRMLKKLADQPAPKANQLFTQELLARALGRTDKLDLNCQLVLGSLADLAIQAYATQSARARAQRNAAFDDLANLFENEANAKSAAIFACLFGESCTIPAPHSVDIASVAERVYHAKGPIGVP